jgi:hypothetical protein
VGEWSLSPIGLRTCSECHQAGFELLTGKDPGNSERGIHYVYTMVALSSLLQKQLLQYEVGCGYYPNPRVLVLARRRHRYVNGGW